MALNWWIVVDTKATTAATTNTTIVRLYLNKLFVGVRLNWALLLKTSEVYIYLFINLPIYFSHSRYILLPRIWRATSRRGTAEHSQAQFSKSRHFKGWNSIAKQHQVLPSRWPKTCAGYLIDWCSFLSSNRPWADGESEALAKRSQHVNSALLGATRWVLLLKFESGQMWDNNTQHVVRGWPNAFHSTSKVLRSWA